MWTLPDKGEGQNDIQSILFQEYLEVLTQGIQGQDFVTSGCAVTAQGAPNLTVAVAAGVVWSNGVRRAVTAGNVTIGAANATNPRIDLVVVDSTGTKQCRAGTAAAAPKPPARTTDDVVLAAIYVPANDTTISTDQITDLRLMNGRDYVTASLAADVSIAAAGTFVDGPGVSLDPGTWLIVANATISKSTTTLYQGTTRIGDGTTHLSSGQDTCASNNPSACTITMTAIVKLTVTTTIKIQATASTTSCALKAACPTSASGNNATTITAKKILPV
jgi:hypothetical protein